MFLQVLTVAVVITAAFLATAPLVSKVLVRVTERRYTAMLAEAMEQAEFCGKMGYLFRAEDYGDILSIQDVLSVRETYRAAVLSKAMEQVG